MRPCHKIMSKIAKIRHHVVQALGEGLVPCDLSETSVEAMAAVLRSKHIEYKFEAPAKLKEGVREAIPCTSSKMRRR